MRITRLNGLFALLLVSGLQAQSPPAPAAVTPRLDTAQARVIVATLDRAAVDSNHYKVEFENEHVRVPRIHYEAHEKGEMHEHILNRVVVYLNDQRGGKANDVRMAGAATHAEENASDQPADRIAVELK